MENCFSFVLAHSASFMQIWTLLNFFVEKHFIHSVKKQKKNVGGLDPQSPPGLCLWTLHAFGLSTLASLLTSESGPQKSPKFFAYISQKLKVAQKKTQELKNYFQSNTYLFCKFGHFWKTFFLVGKFLVNCKYNQP